MFFELAILGCEKSKPSFVNGTNEIPESLANNTLEPAALNR